jgi:hypothetical protein
MMTADQYRAKADELSATAEAAPDDTANAERRAMALEWRRLAVLADWQQAVIDDLRAQGRPRDL